ncbi:uncharacterized protein HMPREF1541_06851 [Cyphellophora europaea CBS 101466]|uniref:Uncharacterized protein n=1 Tax=Cyphellophora europaea (strain CBS 101466) TaxID=1220924 RepID=W2RQS5_CYPE1|nr:uncharacterized protein HMPREF1541_06851 [Cyphellophora europaea CBS 101466]ETN38812.1 hypothetical protein HMPREF1541_06851 [Cyphellophora europaea CBS 101466]
MASPVSIQDYEDAIKDLCDHIRKGFALTDLIDIPQNIWQPFRKPAVPASTTALRPISTLFVGKNQHRLLHLSPATFSGVASLALYAKDSGPHHRLIHGCIDAVRTWKDNDSVLEAFKRCKVKRIDTNDLVGLRKSLIEHLIPSVTRALIDDTIGSETRWLAAQFLSAVINRDSQAQVRLATHTDCSKLGTLLQSHNDYVLRFLVSDTVRELLSNGIEGQKCWPNGTAPAIIASFPAETSTSAAWLSSVQDFLSDMDRGTAFSGTRPPVFKVTRAQRWKNNEPDEGEDSAKDCLLVVTDQITSIVSANDRGLVIACYPICTEKRMVVSLRPATTTGPSSLTIDYQDEQGFEIKYGTRTALSSIKFELSSMDCAAAMAQELDVIQKDVENCKQSGTQHPDAGSLQKTLQQRRSIALLDLWAPQNAINVDNDRRIDNLNENGDTQALTPLQHKCRVIPGNDGLHQILDDFLAPAVSEDEHLDSPTSFGERLRAFQETRSNSKLNIADAEPSRVLHYNGLESLKDVNVPSSNVAQTATGEPDPNHERPDATSTTKHKPTTAARPKQQPMKVASAPKKSAETVSQIPRFSSKVTSPRKTAVLNVSPRRTRQSKDTAFQSTAGRSKGSGEIPVLPKQSEIAFSDGTSQPPRLKRIEPRDRGPKSDVDWDEDIRDYHEMDVLNDDTEALRRPQTRHDKTQTGRPSQKAGPSNNSQATSQQRFRKPSRPSKPAPAPLKKPNTRSGNAKSSVGKTSASSRPRRSTKTQAYDESDEDQSQVSATEEKPSKVTYSMPLSQSQSQSRSSQKFGSGHSSPNKQDPHSPIDNSKDEAEEPNELAGALRKRSVEGTAQMPIEFSDDSPPASGSKLKAIPLLNRFPGEEGREALAERESTNEGSNEAVEEAWDSYPLANGNLDATASSASIDFASNLSSYVLDLQGSIADKENIPPAPGTPFGDRQKFVVSVNAWKSGNTKKPAQVARSNGHATSPANSSRIQGERQCSMPAQMAQQLPTASHADKAHAQGAQSAGTGVVGAAISSSTSHRTHNNHGPNTVNDVRKADHRVTEAPCKVDSDEVADQMEQEHASGITERRVEARNHIPKHANGITKASMYEPPRLLTTSVVGAVLNKSVDQMGEVTGKRTDVESTEAGGTPLLPLKAHRKSTLSRTEAEASARTPVIHFARSGPTNQGRRSGDSFRNAHTKTPTAPQLEVEYYGLKSYTGRELIPADETPNRDAGLGRSEPLDIETDSGFIDKEDQVDLYEEHGTVNPTVPYDGGAAPHTCNVDESEIEDQSYGRFPLATPDTAQVSALDAEKRSKDDAAELPSGPAVSSPPSDSQSHSSEPSDGEASAYQGSEVSGSCSAVSRKAQHGEQEYDAISKRQKPSLEDHTGLPLEADYAPPVIKDAGRTSIGISNLVQRSFPKAEGSITTVAFRKQSGRSQQSVNKIPATSVVNAFRPPKGKLEPTSEPRSRVVVKAMEAGLPVDTGAPAPSQKAMPPPPKRRLGPYQRIESTKLETRPLASTRAERAFPSRTEPIPKAVPRHPPAPIRVKVKETDDGLAQGRPYAPISTPIAFRSQLEEDAVRMEEDMARRGTSTHADDSLNERTLVNDDSCQAGVFLGGRGSFFRSRHEPDDSTNDQVSITGHEEVSGYEEEQDVWTDGVRITHKGLFDTIMHITRNVLFRLGTEEDAVRSKQSDLERGGELMIEELGKNWEKRIEHEQARLIENLRYEHARLASVCPKIQNPFTSGRQERLLDRDTIRGMQGGLNQNIEATEQMAVDLAKAMGMPLDDALMKAEKLP